MVVFGASVVVELGGAVVLGSGRSVDSVAESMWLTDNCDADSGKLISLRAELESLDSLSKFVYFIGQAGSELFSAELDCLACEAS